jgi:hypothetical protein
MHGFFKSVIRRFSLAVSVDAGLDDEEYAPRCLTDPTSGIGTQTNPCYERFPGRAGEI